MNTKFISIKSYIINVKDLKKIQYNKYGIDLIFSNDNYNPSDRVLNITFQLPRENMISYVFDQLKLFLTENSKEGNKCLFDFDLEKQNAEKWIENPEKEIKYFEG